MKELTLEDVYHSYIKDGVIGNWKLELVFKESHHFECFFTELKTGKKEVCSIPASANLIINHKVEAIFCD
ncbi:MAG: hypothetical protein KTR26_09995 [Flammeovirgaceae bacterium]|nr:hypothetical protein [Flammeovirgaceae bacterium]